MAPTGPPVQPLTKLGFWGSMTDFNNSVQAVHDFYAKFNGTKPDQTTMLTEALNHAKAQQAQGPADTDLTRQAKQSTDYRLVRHDGYTESNTPMRQLIYGKDQWHDMQGTPEWTPTKTLKQFQDIQTKHPWVAAGMLPLPPQLMSAVNAAVAFTQTDNPGAQKLMMGGQTLDQYTQQNKLGEWSGLTQAQRIALEHEQKNFNPNGTLGAGVSSSFLTPAQAQAVRTVHAVNTISKAQDHLKLIAPQFFSQLDSTGVINTDWASAIKKYMTTPMYFRQQTVQTATDNGFGNNTGAFIKAWGNKQNALKKNPFLHQLIMAQPLFMFAGGEPGFGAMKNYFTGNAKGLGWFDVPSWGLHALSATAGLAFGELGGAISNVEGDANALTKYISAITINGKGEKQARLDALKVAQETHPHIINLVWPGYGGTPTPDQHGGYETKGGVLQLATEAIFDILIGAPKFTGEKILAGASAMDSRYFMNTTQMAFDGLKNGGSLTDAVKSLEGGMGAKRLVTHLAPGIKDGTVDIQAFRAATHDVFRYGSTKLPDTIEVLPRASTVSEMQPSSVMDLLGEVRGKKMKGADRYAEDALLNYAGTKVVVSRSNEGKLMGVTNARNEGDQLRIENMQSVAGTKGAGVDMLHAWAQEAIRNENKEIILQSSDKAEAFYEKFGFKKIERPGKGRGGDTGWYSIDPHELLQNTTSITSTPGATITGPLLRSLRTRDLPTPGRVGMNAKELRVSVANTAKDFEKGLQQDGSKFSGVTNHAGNFLANIRMLTNRAEPGNDLRAIGDERLPEDVHNWLVANHIMDEESATATADKVIEYQATGNTGGIVRLGDKMRELFNEAHPGNPKPKENPIEAKGVAELDSEQKSYLYFPDTLDTRAAKLQQRANQVGQVHRELLVSGPGAESVGWKHTFADTMRRILGGGGFGRTGVEKLGATVRAVADHMRENPEAIREIGVNRAAAESGEQRYITGSVGGDPKTFNTGQHFDDPKMMQGAGAYLRHNLSTNALRAYQRSTATNFDPLTAYLLQSKEFRSMMFNDADYLASVKGLREQYKPPEGQLLLEPEAWAGARDSSIHELQKETAQTYAEMLMDRYKSFEDAGKKAGVADPLNEALGVLIDNVGAHSDAALGNWIKEKQIGFDVKDGPVKDSRWDEILTNWIHFLMTPNRWNRRVMFDHVFYGTVKDLTDVGWKMEEAIPVAADLAKAQTIYHMLDFANMLKYEKDLRYVSYFMTKRRLYWTWILKQARQRPGLALAASNIKDHLDSKGNLSFPADGHVFSIPVEKLFWLNDHSTYPETSPIIQYGANVGKGFIEGQGVTAFGNAVGSLTATSGNLFTRADQTVEMASKLALIGAGVMSPTSDAVTAGMGATQKLYFQEEVNKYSAFYHAKHGVWPSEGTAVKWALHNSIHQDFWRNYLPLPITWDDNSTTPAEVQKKINAFHKIADPAKARQYLDKNPDVALRMGITQDPAVFLHNNSLWDQYNNARNELEVQRNALYVQMLDSGYTMDTRKEMSKLSKWWSGVMNHLMLQDAQNWHGNAQFPAGKVSDNQVVQQGPWATQLEGDPFAARAFIHDMYPNIPAAQLAAGTVGETVAQLRKESSQLHAAQGHPVMIHTLGYASEQEVKTRLSEVSKVLAPFNGFPHDAATAVQDAYYKEYVTPYQAKRDALTNAANNASSEKANAIHSELRAWKDQHDHPVTVIYKGHKVNFPSPVRIGWATLPPAQRRQALAQAVAGDWAHVASYEKDFLGVPRSPDVSAGWAFLSEVMQKYNQDPNNSSISAAGKLAAAKVINASYPGFYQDYLFSTKPKVERFEYTNLYKSMPGKEWFDTNIGSIAKQIAAKIASDGHATYYERVWKTYVRTQIDPYLSGQPVLARELKNYGPNFLNTLVSHG